VSRGHLIVSSAVAAVAAVVLLLLACWLTSGSYSPVRVHGFDLLILFPMVVMAKLGLGRESSLAVAFLTYFATVFCLCLTSIAHGDRQETRAELER
jgi:hypothetical protein